jgi:hypothetical protein
MVAKARSIDVPVDSEIAKLLREADEAPVVFVVGDERYRVLRDDTTKPSEDIWADYDPAKAVAGMLAAAGSITPEEGDRWIENIYRWRREGSRPAGDS